MKTLMLTLAALAVSFPATAQGYDRGSGDDRRFEGRGGYDERGDDRRFDRRGRRSVRTFEVPRIGGLALDICPRDVGWDGLARGRCGLPVANEFCRSRGFADAVDAPTTQGLGPTRFIRTGGVVDHQWATGFRYITCER